MNITSAFISDDKVYLEYGLNTTGWITGVTYSVSKHTHWDEPNKFYPGDEFAVIYTPHWSGTTKTETITVTGVDEGGTQRSDTAVLKQAPLTKLTGTEYYKPDYGNIQEYVHRITDDGTLLFEGRIDGQPGETFQLFGTVGGYEGYEYGCYIPLFEGVISPLPVPITSLTLNVDNLIVDSGVAAVSFEPGSASTMNIAFSSSDTSKAVIDSNGNITVKGAGEVTICARDLDTGLQDCKTVTLMTGATNHYFTIYVTGAGDLHWSADSSYVENCQYRKNNGEWIASEGFTLEVEPGDLFEFKCDCKNKTGQGGGSNRFDGTTCEFITFGNVMSLAYGDNYLNQNTLVNENQFTSLFVGCTGLTYAENLSLPATALTKGCYQNMFTRCTSLVAAPELPATDLTDKIQCYSFMFSGCTSLREAPELPATALSQSCYFEMFYGCTSLTTAPALPATSLGDYCYYEMFRGCTNLATAPVLPATTLMQNCYEKMFYGCTSLVSAPELPATTLTAGCYQGMFRGCTSLEYVKSLATTNLMNRFGLYNWLTGVSPTGLFIKSQGASVSDTSSTNVYERGASGIPVNWTVENAT